MKLALHPFIPNPLAKLDHISFAKFEIIGHITAIIIYRFAKDNMLWIFWGAVVAISSRCFRFTERQRVDCVRAHVNEIAGKGPWLSVDLPFKPILVNLFGHVDHFPCGENQLAVIFVSLKIVQRYNIERWTWRRFCGLQRETKRHNVMSRCHEDYKSEVASLLYSIIFYLTWASCVTSSGRSSMISTNLMGNIPWCSPTRPTYQSLSTFLTSTTSSPAYWEKREKEKR